MEREAAALAAASGVAVTSLRIGNIAGLDAILGNWRPGFSLDRFDDGQTPRRSYIGMTTLADALAALLARDDLPPVLNIAEPGAVSMGDLLDRAGLDWSPRAAPGSAIPQVELEVSKFATLWPGLPPRADAGRMVHEWRQCCAEDVA